MPNKCWICEDNVADSGEHAILKSALETIIGKPEISESRYVSYIDGRRNVPVNSFKNKRFKFSKSICKHCNNKLSQPYDDAFRIFIEISLASKGLSIMRNRIVLPKNTDNLALYFIKIFGCLIVENKARIIESDYQLFRNSLLCGKVLTNNVFFSMHRDLAKLAVKKGSTVGQYPIIEKDFITWTIDLDWVSLILSYPYPLPNKYGTSWQLGESVSSIKLGKLR